MGTYLNIALIIVSILLTLAVLFQVRSSGLGGVFGSSTSVFLTRRGLEKTLFQFTLVLIALFVVLTLLAVRLA